MATVVRLSPDLLEGMIVHALADAPVECCGVVAGREGVATAVHPARNTEGSPYRFNIDPLEFMRLSDRIEGEGGEVLGFYHSHTGSEARPSPTDIRMMGPLFGPPFVHFVVGVADREHPVVRVFHIAGDVSIEHEYETTAGAPAGER